jgi:hypothetical protein
VPARGKSHPNASINVAFAWRAVATDVNWLAAGDHADNSHFAGARREATRLGHPARGSQTRPRLRTCKLVACPS